jgi:integrase
MKGYIQQAGPNKWRITYDLPRGADGIRRQKRETVTGPKRKAQARLAELQHTLYTGVYVEPTGLTVKDWLESWLAKYAKVKLSARSYEMHCVNLRKHVIPAIGHVLLHRLETEHLQGLYADLLKVLAPTTVARIRSVVADALNQAVDGKRIVSNPNSRVKLPENLKTTRTKPMVVYTEGQVSTLLKAVKASPLSIEVLLGVATGMRLGEVLAVKWAAISWEARTIRSKRHWSIPRSTASAPKRRRRGADFGPYRCRRSPWSRYANTRFGRWSIALRGVGRGTRWDWSAHGETGNLNWWRRSHEHLTESCSA